MGEKKVDLKKALETLYELGVKKFLVEGGGELIFSLLKNNLVDEINLKIGNLIIGGRETTTFCDGDGFGMPSFKKVKFVKVIKKPNCLILKLKVVKWLNYTKYYKILIPKFFNSSDNLLSGSPAALKKSPSIFSIKIAPKSWRA